MSVIFECGPSGYAIIAWNDGTILVAQLVGNSTKFMVSLRPWNEWNVAEEYELYEGTISCLASLANTPWKFISGSTDGQVIIWQLEQAGSAVDGACPMSVWWDGNHYSLCDEYCRLGKGGFRESTSINVRMLKTFTGHTQSVTAVSCSATEGLVVSGAADSTLRVWSFETGQELYLLKEFNGIAKCIAMSADGSLIAVGSGTEVQLWRSSASEADKSKDSQTSTSPQHDISPHKLAQALKVDEGEVTSVAVSTNGVYVAFGSTRKAVQVWDTSSGQTVHTLLHDGPVNAVTMSAGSTFIISASVNGSLCIWDRKTGKQLASLDSKDAPAAHLAISGDGSIIGTISEGQPAKVWAWLAEPDTKASQRVAQLAAWEGRPTLLRSRINVFGAEGAGKSSVISALAGRPKHGSDPLEHQTSGIDITYYQVERTPDIDAANITPITRDTAGYHLLAWQKAVENKLVELRNEGRTYSEVTVEPLATSETKNGQFDIPELNDVVPQLYTPEVDAVVHDRLKNHPAQLRGRAVVYEFGCFPGHDILYPLFLTKDDYHLIVFDMQELQPGEDDGLRTIRGVTQTVAQWREQCIAHLKSWAAPLKKFDNHNIFLVGTRRDLVSQQDDHRAVHKLLYAEFEDRFLLNFQEQLCFFPVDTTAGAEDEFISHLRYRTAWRSEIMPVKHLRFLAALERMQKPLVTLEDALTVGKADVDMETDAVKSTLLSLHSSGLLAWWPDVNDGSHVVVDLPWFIAKVVPIVKAAKTTEVPLESLFGKMEDVPADQLAFFCALASRMVTLPTELDSQSHGNANKAVLTLDDWNPE